MKNAEMRLLIGKSIRYKSDKTRAYTRDIWSGTVTQVMKRETEISGDWHNTKSIEVIEVAE